MTSPQSAPSSPARVVVTTGPLWAVRLRRNATHYLIRLVALVGLAASLRFALLPPRPPAPSPSRAAAPSDARGAEAFATQFARRYLTWNAVSAEAGAEALEPYFGAGVEPGGGVELPSRGEQRVEWAEVVQARRLDQRTRRYIVAAAVVPSGLVYLSVDVRISGGRLELAGYPAFVGPPLVARAGSPQPVPTPVSDPALVTVVERVIGNYLDDAPGELAADLVNGARVSLPQQHMSLSSVQRPAWIGDGRVLAVVQARSPDGAQYTLAYELLVVHDLHRWEVAQVQVNPSQ